MAAADIVATNVSKMTNVCADRQPRSGNFALDTKNATNPTVIVMADSRTKRSGPTKIQVNVSTSKPNQATLTGSSTKQAVAARKATIRDKNLCLTGFPNT
jgi:hypothetical protein